MIGVLANSWALFLGMLFLMVGNGMQGTLLGVRGEIEGFTTFQLSLVMSAYFVGFLGGSRLAPEMIRRVGHVRVFAALGSFISAVLILYPAMTNPVAWIALRVVIGFCFSGVYVTAESWLNNASTSKTRGQTLSLYMIVQMGGIVAAQSLLLFGDPSGFILFIIPSVLVSMSFAPILLSINPTPAFDRTKPMSFRTLFRASPLGCVGMVLTGGVYSAQFGMASVYATQAGFTVAEVATFVGAIYLGGLLFQYPIGWLSDRFDRRSLILAAACIGALSCLLGLVPGVSVELLTLTGFVIGGMSNPLYALLIAYTADHLEYEDMAAASGRLVFLNGIGAIAGPIIMAGIIAEMGPEGFWAFIVAMMLLLAVYATYRSTRRVSPGVEEYGQYIAVSPTFTTVGLEAAQEWAHESDIDAGGESDEARGSA